MLLLVITQKTDWPFLFERADILGMDYRICNHP
jgi:hypothetical protein